MKEKSEFNQKIADRLYWIRTEIANMTQVEFASYLSVKHRNIISDWERGKRRPGIKNISMLVELANKKGHSEVTVQFLRPDLF